MSIPQNIIRVLEEVPLDNRYINTILFDDKAKQEKYFIGKTAHKLVGQSYTRISENKCRVSVNAYRLNSCNYIMFQNADFGDKWFYAFITESKYVNEATSEITFELDVMQTYMFDYTVPPCFVEREHVSDDSFGANVVEEPVELGDIVCYNMETYLFSSMVAVVATSYDPDGQPGSKRGGLVSGLSYFVYDLGHQEDVERLFSYLNGLNNLNKVDSVVSIFYFPYEFVQDEWTSNPKGTSFTTKFSNTPNGYTPRNKKLLTYPYHYLSVSSSDNDAIYRYEYFKGGQLPFSTDIDFNLYGAISCNPQIACVPYRYLNDSVNYRWTEKIVETGFPQIAYSIDSFRAWLATEATTNKINTLGNMGTIAAGAISGNFGGIVSGALGLAHNLNAITVAKCRPNQARGQQTGDIDVASGKKGFYFKHMFITKQYAEIIDSFFDRYGYAVNRVKELEINSRHLYNYVKTRDCTIIGKLSAENSRKIQEIYDKGITFWHNPLYVGDYSRMNTIK